MTPKEAIQELKDASDSEVRYGDTEHHYDEVMKRVETFDMAIKALEQQPCEDCIRDKKAWRLGYERGIYNATIHEGFTPVAWYTLSDSEIEKVEEKIKALKSQSCEELKAKALVERYRNEKFNIHMISTTDDDYPLIMRDLPNKEKYQLLGINDAVFVPLYQVIDEITGIKADIIKRNGVECCPTCMKPITPQQKVGKWINNPDADYGGGFFICSECGAELYEVGKYCSECGSYNGGEDE